MKTATLLAALTSGASALTWITSLDQLPGARGGDITYFGLSANEWDHPPTGKDGPHPGACAIWPKKAGYFAALNGVQFTPDTYRQPGNPNTASVCGLCAEITGPAGSVVVEIVDKCPSCKDGDIDVGLPAFIDAVGDQRVGRTKMTWKAADCSRLGPVTPGSNPAPGAEDGGEGPEPGQGPGTDTPAPSTPDDKMTGDAEPYVPDFDDLIKNAYSGSSVPALSGALAALALLL